jgi:outer membrane protein assembly factor BamA
VQRVCCSGTAEISLGLANNLGYAEDVKVSVEIGSKSSTDFALEFTKPRLYGAPVNTTCTAHQQNRNYEQSSYSDQLRGASTMLFRCARTPLGVQLS